MIVHFNTFYPKAGTSRRIELQWVNIRQPLISDKKECVWSFVVAQSPCFCLCLDRIMKWPGLALPQLQSNIF